MLGNKMGWNGGEMGIEWIYLSCTASPTTRVSAKALKPRPRRWAEALGDDEVSIRARLLGPKSPAKPRASPNLL